MKKLLPIFAIIVVASCSTDDTNQPQVYYELLPIESCEVPDSLVAGETYQMELRYILPTTCHFYTGIYYEKQSNTRIIAIQSGVRSDDQCVTNPAGDTLSTTLNFQPTINQTYILKFWKGKNEQGEDIYYEEEVPVGK